MPAETPVQCSPTKSIGGVSIPDSTLQFKEDIIQAFYNGIRKKPGTTFGNVKADVIADKDPRFVPGNFCSVIRNSTWIG